MVIVERERSRRDLQSAREFKQILVVMTHKREVHLSSNCDDLSVLWLSKVETGYGIMRLKFENVSISEFENVSLTVDEENRQTEGLIIVQHCVRCFWLHTESESCISCALRFRMHISSTD